MLKYTCSLCAGCLTLLITIRSLALVDGSSLVIGSVDQIQMLHIETIPMGESVRLVPCVNTCMQLTTVIRQCMQLTTIINVRIT